MTLLFPCVVCIVVVDGEAVVITVVDEIVSIIVGSKVAVTIHNITVTEHTGVIDTLQCVHVMCVL